MKLYKVAELSEILRLSKSKIYDLVNQGKLRHYKIDGTILVSEEQLQHFLEACEVEGVSRLEHIILSE